MVFLELLAFSTVCCLISRCRKDRPLLAEPEKGKEPFPAKVGALFPHMRGANALLFFYSGVILNYLCRKVKKSFFAHFSLIHLK
jgi:hypothetical protein